MLCVIVCCVVCVVVVVVCVRCGGGGVGGRRGERREKGRDKSDHLVAWLLVPSEVSLRITDLDSFIRQDERLEESGTCCSRPILDSVLLSVNL